MSVEVFLFFASSVVLVGAALAVITVKNSVHAALFLVLTFFTSAALWLLLQAEFLAIALVLVYVGAVMVLFLFVVMMLDIDVEKLRAGFRSYIPVGATVGILILFEMMLVLIGGYFGSRAVPSPPAAPASYSNTRALGL